MEVKPANIFGVFTTDQNLKVQLWDPALERMTGIASESVVGKLLIEVVPDLSARGLLERFERSLKTGTTEILAPALHQRLIKCPPASDTQHFKEMQQQVKITPMTDGSSILGLVVTIEDATDRMEQKMSVISKLRHEDRRVRLDVAREIAEQTDPIPTEMIDPIIKGLGDPDWRVRRRLTEAVSKRTAPETVHALLRALQEKHLDFGTVNSALQVLRSIDVDATGTLIEFLHTDDVDLRIQAALALGEYRDEHVVEALLSALQDPDANVRYQAIESLGRASAHEAVETLMEIAETRDFFLAFAALEALKAIRPASIESRLVPFLEDDFFWEPAARILAATGSAEVADQLFKLMGRDSLPVGTVSGIIVEFLERFDGEPDRGSLPGSHELSIEFSEESVARIAEAIGAGEAAEIESILTLGGRIPSRPIAQALAKRLRDPELIIPASKALVRQGSVAVEVLIPELRSDEEAVREISAELLGLARSEQAVDELIKALKRGDVSAAAAIRALGMIGGDAATEEILGFLSSDSIEHQMAGIEGTIHLGDSTGKKELMKLLASLDAEVRRAAVEACGKLRLSDSYEYVVGCLKDDDPSVRKAAARSLRSIGGEKGAPHVAALLKDEEPSVRATAASALSEYTGNEASNALVDALGDSDSWTRYFALRAIGNLKAVSCTDAVRRIAFGDPAEHVRMAASDVLNELGV